MISFRKIQLEWDFEERKKVCLSCQREHTFYVCFAYTVYPSSLECQKCHHLLWYMAEGDSVLGRYFGNSSAGRTSKESAKIASAVNEKVEALVSPCSCGGSYRHVNAWEAGVPKNCPYCSVLYEEKQERKFFDCTKLKVRPPILKKLPVTKLSFYDDSLPDFSNSSPEELRYALRDPDLVHRRRALMSISKLKGSFPYPDDLLRLASDTADPTARLLCIETLGRKGSISAVPYLISLLEKKDSQLQASTEHALLMITSQLIPEEFSGFLRLKKPEGEMPSTPNEWKRWWQEHKDSVKIRDYPPRIKEKMGLA